MPASFSTAAPGWDLARPVGDLGVGAYAVACALVLSWVIGFSFVPLMTQYTTASDSAAMTGASSVAKAVPFGAKPIAKTDTSQRPWRTIAAMSEPVTRRRM